MNDGQSLAVSLRPRKLEEMVGRRKTAESIRKYGRKPMAWMFVGPAGTGKTTIARILALSYQCGHKPFGSPCKACRKNSGAFDIQEINASHFRGVEDVEQIVEMAQFFARPPTEKRVIILDEAQRMSVPAQNMLLQPFESGPETTVWIVCTTNPEKIIKPLRARCTTFALRPLRASGVRDLCRKAGAAVGLKDNAVESLAEACFEREVRSPRDVVKAVERMATGASAEVAASAAIGDAGAFDAAKLCSAVVKKRRKETVARLKELTSEAADGTVRVALGYLKAVMLGERSEAERVELAATIQSLAEIVYLDDHAKMAAFSAIMVLHSHSVPMKLKFEALRS